MGLLKVLKNSILITCRSYSENFKMKYLNVAEKNDAAKTIAGFLSRGASRRREGFSPYNKIYEFNAEVFNQNVSMIMTSVSGHLLNYEFIGTYRNWNACNPLDLFDAPVVKSCLKDYEKIKRTLEREIRSCNALIIWTDCDREGENIGFEIINVCKAVKPNINVYRARFSEITAASIFRALNTLGEPNKNVNDSVDVRQELDLRIGAAFTRVQTLRLQKAFPNTLSDNLISYGSCQFPTLGFVVDRYKAAEDFIPEPFWKIKMCHTVNDLTVEFHWSRNRLFEKRLVEVLLDTCLDNPTATVTSVVTKPKSKWRPLPLDTVEMGKAASRLLRMDAKTAMKIAEKLYTQGFISYPRTETNIFPKELHLTPLVQNQIANPEWGPFANRILEWGGPTPRQGKKSDQAHPPIHPIKYTDSLSGDDKKLYEFIVRHFLACCSKDAQGMETVVKVDIAREIFEAKGLMIIERNYLDVYIYEKWNAKEIHIYQEGQQFEPTFLDMIESATTAPQLLTEADLIGLMEKHGIGTDATHAEHIATVMSRNYVGKLDGGPYLTPGLLGMGLVEGYDRIGLEVSLAKPNLRAELEADLKRICDGLKDPQIVLQEQIAKYREVYRTVITRLELIDSAIGTRLQIEPADNVANALPQFTDLPSSPFKCPKCGYDMVIRSRKTNQGKYIGCSAFPACNNAVWLPAEIKNISVTDQSCSTCGPSYKKLKFEFIRPMYATYLSPHIACLGGCDNNILMDFNININSVSKKTTRQISQSTSNSASVDSGIGPSIQQSRSERTLNNYFVTNHERNASNTNNVSQNRTQSNRNINLNNNALQNTNQNSRNINFNNNASFHITNSHSISNTQNTRNNRSNYNSTENPSDNLRQNTSDITVSWGRQANGTSEQRSQQVRQTNENYNGIVCNCNQPARQYKVNKEGPNKDRLFYKCATHRDNGGCDFFIWAADDPSQPSTSNYNQNNRTIHNVNVMRSPTNATLPNAQTGEILCNCRIPAVLRTTQKDTPNKGRQFYVCSKPQANQCRFFQWADECDLRNNNNGGDDWGDGGGGGGGGGGSGGGGYGGRGTGNWATTSGDWGGTSSSTNNWNVSKNSKSNNSWQKKKGNVNGKKRKFSSLDSNSSSNKGKRKCGLCGEEGHIRTKCPNK